MTQRDALTKEIDGLEVAFESLLASAGDAIVDGEWDTAGELFDALRVLDRQIEFRRDDLAELIADEEDDGEVIEIDLDLDVDGWDQGEAA